MSTVSKHPRCPQARTSITKAGQLMGCAQMHQCVANWLKQSTDSGCLA